MAFRRFRLSKRGEVNVGFLCISTVNTLKNQRVLPRVGHARPIASPHCAHCSWKCCASTPGDSPSSFAAPRTSPQRKSAAGNGEMDEAIGGRSVCTPIRQGWRWSLAPAAPRPTAGCRASFGFRRHDAHRCPHREILGFWRDGVAARGGRFFGVTRLTPS